MSVGEVTGGNTLFDVRASIVATSNLPPYDLTLSQNRTPYGSPKGYVVGTLTGYDLDDTDILTYSLVNNGGGRYAVDRVTGTLYVAADQLVGSAGYQLITARTTDKFGLSFTKEFYVYVNAPPYLTTGYPPSNQSMFEDASVLFQIPSGLFTDPEGDSIIYSVSTDSGYVTSEQISDTVFRFTPSSNFNGEVGVIVSASDSAFYSAQTYFRLRVGSVNDIPTAPIYSGAFIVDENTAPGTIIGRVSSFDADIFSAYIYDQLTYYATSAFFNVDASGVVRVGNIPLDYEILSSYSLNVSVTDLYGGSNSSVHVISVRNIDEAPLVAEPIANRSSPEDAPWSLTVPADSFSDPERDTLTYSASLANDSPLPGWLTFNAATRTFNGTPPLNFNGSLELKVTAAANGKSASDTFILNVTPVDDAPVVTTPIADQSSPEDYFWSFRVPAGTFIDRDGDTLSYSASLSDGSPLPNWLRFDTTALSFAGRPPTNFNGVHNLRVTASANGQSVSDDFVWTVIPVNDPPDVLDFFSNSLPENSPAGTVVGDLFSYDPDSSPIYSLVDNAGGRFSVNATTGRVTVAAGAVLNYENWPSHSILARVMDQDGLSLTREFVILVRDVNEAPVIFSSGGGSTAALVMAENSTRVTAVSARDPDVGTTITYSIAGGPDAARFAIHSGSDELIFVSAPDFDAPLDAGANNVYEVIVRASDGALFDDQSLSISVTNVNEAPTALTLGNSAVAENSAAGTYVGSLVGADPDSDSLTYALTNAAGGRFVVDSVTGNITVAAGAVLDFEAAASQTITARVTDPGGLSFTRSFNLTVTNVDEAPAVATPIPDRQSAEDELWVYTVPAGSFTDPDGDTLTYSASLANDTALPAWLSFNAATRTFSGFPPLNFNGTIDLKVTAAANGKAVSDVFTLAVTPVNDAPIDVTLSNAGIAENSVAGTLVGTLKGEDLDNSTGLTYALTDNAGGRFTVAANSGNITVAPGVVLDFEAASSHNITARVTDPGGLSFTRSFTIAVGNVDEAPLLVRRLSPDFAINGGEQWNYSLADGYFVDPEGDALSYDVRPADGSNFLPYWAYFNQFNGVLYVNPPLDLGGAFNFSVTATANGKSASGIFSLTVYAAAPPQRYLGTNAGDVFTADNAGVRWSVDGRGGNDRLTTGDSNDTIIGGAGNDTINAGGGDDVIIFNTAGTTSGFDQVDGGAGYDEIRAVAHNAVIGLTSLSNVELINGNGYSGVVVSGSGGNDRLDFSGTTLTEIGMIKGGAGNDTIIGSIWDDFIDGEAGKDMLYGGSGYDVFLARGNVTGDRFDGGDDYDAINAMADNTTIAYASLTSIEAIGGNYYSNARLVGTSANDTIDLSAMEVYQIIVDAGAGNDIILGTVYDDVIVGGAGSDTITGGMGFDRFVYNSAREGGDRIDGFEVGFDLIDLSTIDANTLLAGNQAFTFIGDSPFSRTPGELRVLRPVPSFEQVFADTNGDGRADYYLLLQTDVDVTESDFLL